MVDWREAESRDKDAKSVQDLGFNVFAGILFVVTIFPCLPPRLTAATLST